VSESLLGFLTRLKAAFPLLVVHLAGPSPRSKGAGGIAAPFLNATSRVTRVRWWFLPLIRCAGPTFRSDPSAPAARTLPAQSPFDTRTPSHTRSSRWITGSAPDRLKQITFSPALTSTEVSGQGSLVKLHNPPRSAINRQGEDQGQKKS
jgi:hypothetical protein